MLVYIKTSSKKRKNKKSTLKERELQTSWQLMLDKYKSPPSSVYNKANQPATLTREIKKAPSLETMLGNCNKPAVIMYTGDAIIGLSTMHKSNTVPVFSKEEAESHAKMRRG